MGKEQGSCEAIHIHVCSVDKEKARTTPGDTRNPLLQAPSSRTLKTGAYVYRSYKNKFQSTPVLSSCQGQAFPLACLWGALCIKSNRDFQQLWGRENSLPISAWLLGCQEVTWDMDRGEAHTESGRKYGEGGPWRGFPGPATQGH